MKPRFLRLFALSALVLSLGCSTTSTRRFPVTVKVIGWVKHPGVYVLPDSADIITAIKAAGGFSTPFIRVMSVIRTQDGQKKYFRVKLHDRSGHLTHFKILDGDTIFARESFL